MIPDPYEKPLLTMAETAEILGVSISSVYRMAKLGALPTVQLGGSKSTRVRTADLRRDVLGLDR